jgi:hypothetical protein
LRFSFLAEKGKLMIRLLFTAAAALALFGGGIALAAQPTPVPNTPPDFSSFRFEIGTWNCHQTLPGRQGVRREKDTYSMAYDGWQLQAHFDSPPFDKYRTRDVVGDAFTTYDKKLKIWVNQVVDNFGNYGMLTSPGWVGSSITWTGTGPDATAFKLVETKVSDTKEVFASWGNSKKVQPLVNMGSQTCVKSP